MQNHGFIRSIQRGQRTCVHVPVHTHTHTAALETHSRTTKSSPLRCPQGDPLLVFTPCLVPPQPSLQGDQSVCPREDVPFLETEPPRLC